MTAAATTQTIAVNPKTAFGGKRCSNHLSIVKTPPAPPIVPTWQDLNLRATWLRKQLTSAELNSLIRWAQFALYRPLTSESTEAELKQTQRACAKAAALLKQRPEPTKPARPAVRQRATVRPIKVSFADLSETELIRPRTKVEELRLALIKRFGERLPALLGVRYQLTQLSALEEGSSRVLTTYEVNGLYLVIQAAFQRLSGK